jgi:hypothetical protein
MGLDFKFIYKAFFLIILVSCNKTLRKFSSPFEIPFDTTEEEMVYNGFKKVKYGFFKKHIDEDGKILFIHCTSNKLLSGKDWDGANIIEIRFDKKYLSKFNGFDNKFKYFNYGEFKYIVEPPLDARLLDKVYTIINDKKIYNYTPIDTLYFTLYRKSTW